MAPAGPNYLPTVHFQELQYRVDLHGWILGSGYDKPPSQSLHNGLDGQRRRLAEGQPPPVARACYTVPSGFSSSSTMVFPPFSSLVNGNSSQVGVFVQLRRSR